MQTFEGDNESVWQGQGVCGNNCESFLFYSNLLIPSYYTDGHQPIVFPHRLHEQLSWTPNFLHVTSGSLDTDIYIWSMKKPLKTIAIKNTLLVV